MRNLIIIALIFFIHLAGCSDPVISPGHTAEVIQPLKPGSRWIYVDSSFGASTAVDTTEIRLGSKVTLKMAGTPEAYPWMVHFNGTLLRTNFINNDSRGLWHFGEVNENDTLLLKKKWAKYPVNVGDSFIEPRYSYDSRTKQYSYTGDWEWTCVSLRTKIKLSNGNEIDNIVYRAETAPGTETYLYYSPGIGYSGWRIVSQGSTVYVQTLSSYELN
jgi:hypothetical protein